jgi:dienelactone hydrolase
MNHGTADSSKPAQVPRYRFSFSSYYFLSRGYAVVLPMMRGYAGSEGRQILTHCNQESVGLANAKDIRAVIDFMLTQPFIDGDRTVVAGQSLGGWNALAVGTLHHPNIKGLINFAGGANISECNDNQITLARVAAKYGAQTTIPSVWFYGDNDSKFAPAVWRGMYESYRAAGGAAELVSYGRFMTDSHNLLGFPEGLRIWAPKVDAFLSNLGLPNKVKYPEYLPMEFPPSSNFAAIDDVDAVPYLNDGGRQTYRKFLTDPMPRVFVFSRTGLAASFNGGFDPLGRAMNVCREHLQNCQVYAVDDQVTWVRPTPSPGATHFAPIEDMAAVPYLNAAGREAYGKYNTLRKPKAFVIAPDGAWSLSSLGDDPISSAMQSCEKMHVNCALYAVDDMVVWGAKTSH